MKDLNKDIHRIQKKYPGIKFGSHEDARDFVNIHNILEAAFGRVDAEILSAAYLERKEQDLKTPNDYYYLVTKAILKFSNFKKVAYPMGMGTLSEPYLVKSDLEQWVGLVHKIYQAVQSGKMSFHQALDYYASLLDNKDDQRFRFKKWLLYYKNGEHEKYSEEGAVIMKKQSDFQFGLNSVPYDRSPVVLDESVQKQLNDLKEFTKKEEDFVAWKARINGAIRRIDKLLRDDQHLNPEEQADLADMLHAFDLQMRRVRLQSMASDIAFRTAGNFKKVGYSKASEILTAIAQDLSEPIPEAPVAPESRPPAAIPGAPEGAGQGAESPGASEAIGRALEAGEGNEKSPGILVEPKKTPGIRGDLAQAATKLEDVAARLADRRTIRQLAEFDIILDQLGLASLFPELMEAQSKLIDAYSYAMVRVTKMLGMLSSGRSMSEISEAKKTDISNKAIKEVNKTMSQGEEPIDNGKGQGAINQEFSQEVTPPKNIV